MAITAPFNPTLYNIREKRHCTLCSVLFFPILCPTRSPRTVSDFLFIWLRLRPVGDRFCLLSCLLITGVATTSIFKLKALP